MLLLMKQSDHNKRGAVAVNSEGNDIVVSASPMYGRAKKRMLAGALPLVVLVSSLLMGLPATSAGVEGKLART